MTIQVSPDGLARFLIRGNGENPECRIVSDGVETILGHLGALASGCAFEMFPDGRIVLAHFPERRDDNKTRNAAILAPDGAIYVRFHIGYGHEDIQVCPNGRIWVSYFDEGVYSGGEIPSNGLVAFDERGRLVWENRQRTLIDDCYALNVSSAGVWFCAYSSFDLCQVMADGEVSVHQNSVVGAPAFALEGNKVVFAHKYNETPGVMYWAEISSGELGKPQAGRFATSDKTEIPPHGVRMRGGFVHVFAGDGWYRGHISELD